jgi:hypothetical protein
MLGFAFWGLEEQWTGQGEFAGKSGGVYGGEECIYSVREIVKVWLERADGGRVVISMFFTVVDLVSIVDY